MLLHQGDLDAFARPGPRWVRKAALHYIRRPGSALVAAADRGQPQVGC